MASLKSAYDRLGAFFSTSADHFYERQRALVGAGVLQLSGGRGPGSGVQATPETFTALLVSLLATDSIVEAGGRTREILVMRAESDSRRCPLTGAATFGAAMTKVISQPALRTEVKRVGVFRSTLRAYLEYLSGPGTKRIYFSSNRPQHYPVIELEALISGASIREACSMALPDLYED